MQEVELNRRWIRMRQLEKFLDTIYEGWFKDFREFKRKDDQKRRDFDEMFKRSTSQSISDQEVSGDIDYGLIDVIQTDQSVSIPVQRACRYINKRRQRKIFLFGKRN